eukprot:COSAG06_NODE_34065_length_465_cov_1.013123_1_plen_33_part_10
MSEGDGIKSLLRADGGQVMLDLGSGYMEMNHTM